MATAMKKLDLDVHGDIGCYDLTSLPPVSHMHSAFEMGASIPIEQGFTRAGGAPKGSIAVIGDSTFLHSGITGLLNAVHQGANVAVLIQNNDITAMTGGQTQRRHAEDALGRAVHAGRPAGAGARPRRAQRRGGRSLRLRGLPRGAQGRAGVRGAGGRHHQTGPACSFRARSAARTSYQVDEDLCNACQQCMKLGCPSLHHVDAVFKTRHKVAIDAETCTGCSLCAQLCKPGAITTVEAAVAGGAR